MSKQSRQRAVLAAFVLLASLQAGIRLDEDWDMPWHLATGRAAIATHSLLSRDIFSSTFDGAPWSHKDLVADVLLWLAFATLGNAGLALLKALAAATGAFALRSVLPRTRRDGVTALAVCALSIGVCQERVLSRSLLFALALWPATLAALDHARRDPTKRWIDVRVVAVTWVFALLHREGVVAVVHAALLAVYLVTIGCLPRREKLVSFTGPRPSPSAMRTSALTAVCAAIAGLCTPSGFALYRTAFGVLGNARYRTTVSEFRPIGLRDALDAYPITTMIAFVAGATLVARMATALRRRESDPPVVAWHLGVFALHAYLATTSVRWLPHLGFVSVFVLAKVLGDLALRIATPAPRGAGILAALVGVVVLTRANSFTFGLGVPASRFPFAALAYARSRDLSPRPMHTFEFGGDVVLDGWPAIRSFVDGRNDQVFPPSFVAQAVRAERDAVRFASLARTYDTKWVLAANLLGRDKGFAFLAHDPAWSLVFWSEAASVYVRHDAYPELVARDAYRFVDPATLLESIARAARATHGDERGLEAIHEELLRMHDVEPRGVQSNAALAFFDHQRGRAWWPERDRAMRVLAEVAPDHPVVRALRAQIER